MPSERTRQAERRPYHKHVHKEGPIVIALAMNYVKLNAEHMSRIADILLDSRFTIAENTLQACTEHCAANATQGGNDCAVFCKRASQEVFEKTHFHLRAFIGMSDSDPLLLQAVASHLGAVLRTNQHPEGSCNLEVTSAMLFSEYLGNLTSADLALDVHPFSGCNSIQDLLWAGTPVLTLAASHEGASRPLWRTVVGSHMLQRLGFSGLVATDEVEFHRKGVQLLADAKLRSVYRQAFLSNDLSSLSDWSDVAFTPLVFAQLVKTR